MSWEDAAAHWLHLTAAILWVGGTLCTALVVHPVLRSSLPDAARMAVYDEVGRRLLRVQWATWSVLLATGLHKLWSLRATPGVFFGTFGRVLAVKLTLVSAMVALTLLHSLVWGPALVRPDGDAAARAALARKAALWGKVNAALMLAIVFCAALLRYNPW